MRGAIAPNIQDRPKRLLTDNITGVHRCGTGGSMRACYAGGPGSIPGREKVSG